VWELEVLLPQFRRYGTPIAEDYIVCIYKAPAPPAPLQRPPSSTRRWSGRAPAPAGFEMARYAPRPARESADRSMPSLAQDGGAGLGRGVSRVGGGARGQGFCALTNVEYIMHLPNNWAEILFSVIVMVRSPAPRAQGADDRSGDPAEGERALKGSSLNWTRLDFEVAAYMGMSFLAD
jgi:hypothetical protein